MNAVLSAQKCLGYFDTTCDKCNKFCDLVGECQAMQLHEVFPKVAAALMYAAAESGQYTKVKVAPSVEPDLPKRTLRDKSFVISGPVEIRDLEGRRLSREKLAALVKHLGGSVESSITKRTSYLVVSDDQVRAGVSTVKTVEAQKHGVPIMKEQDFIELFSNIFSNRYELSLLLKNWGPFEISNCQLPEENGLFRDLAKPTPIKRNKDRAVKMRVK